MLRRFRQIALVLGIATAMAGAAQAQRPHIGGHLLYNFDVEEFGIGAQFSYPLSRKLEFYPSFDYYFVDPGSLWQLNADLKYKLREEHNWFYVGGGLGIARASVGNFDDTDVGANLFGGWETLIGQRVHPYLEGRLTLADDTRFQLAGGLNITIF
jgi:hypothetical protein